MTATNFTGVMCDVMVEREMDSVLESSLIDTGQAAEWDFLKSFYYTIQTVTTIGFGDIYIHSPGHPILNIAPIVSTYVTAFSIALFAMVVSRLQSGVEKKGEKKILKTRKSVAAIQLGVLKVNLAAKNGTEDNIEEQIVKDENINEVEI